MVDCHAEVARRLQTEIVSDSVQSRIASQVSVANCTMKRQPVAESRDYSANCAIIIGQGVITQSQSNSTKREYTDEKNNIIHGDKNVDVA